MAVIKELIVVGKKIHERQLKVGELVAIDPSGVTHLPDPWNECWLQTVWPRDSVEVSDDQTLKRRTYGLTSSSQEYDFQDVLTITDTELIGTEINNAALVRPRLHGLVTERVIFSVGSE